MPLLPSSKVTAEAALSVARHPQPTTTPGLARLPEEACISVGYLVMFHYLQVPGQLPALDDVAVLRHHLAR